jgi:hypothetical protein
MYGIPPTELAIILVVALLLFFFDWPSFPPAGGAKESK